LKVKNYIMIDDMKNLEFSPRESLERAYKRWWVIVLMTVLGGTAGWAMHFFHPPVYEATATMTGNIDFQKRELTQNEEDYAFNVVEAISTSTEVENQIIVAAQARGILLDMEQLEQQMYSDRKQSVWQFRIRDRDPEIAAELANLWLEKTGEALNAALAHAIRADQIQAQINNITGSQSHTGVPELTAEDRATLQVLSNDLLQEKQSSLGILSIMKFSPSRPAAAPQQPVLYYLAELVLAGACIGFVASLWMVNSHKGQRRG
jgi:uncharacterized protein involved in exopolysaccharide biosynthesis